MFTKTLLSCFKRIPMYTSMYECMYHLEYEQKGTFGMNHRHLKATNSKTVSKSHKHMKQSQGTSVVLQRAPFAHTFSKPCPFNSPKA